MGVVGGEGGAIVQGVSSRPYGYEGVYEGVHVESGCGCRCERFWWFSLRFHDVFFCVPGTGLVGQVCLFDAPAD